MYIWKAKNPLKPLIVAICNQLWIPRLTDSHNFTTIVTDASMDISKCIMIMDIHDSVIDIDSCIMGKYGSAIMDIKMQLCLSMMWL